MYYSIEKLEDQPHLIDDTKEYLFKKIKEEFGLDYVPEYHYDIVDLEKTYINPKRNSFYIALNSNKEIIGTLGIRGYDKQFEFFKYKYNTNKTASLWRTYIDKEYKRHKIGTKLVQIAEDFAKDKQYEEIYLHTQKDLIEGYYFWSSLDYNKTYINDDTIHMEKKLKVLISTIKLIFLIFKIPHFCLFCMFYSSIFLYLFQHLLMRVFLLLLIL